MHGTQVHLKKLQTVVKKIVAVHYLQTSGLQLRDTSVWFGRG